MNSQLKEWQLPSQLNFLLTEIEIILWIIKDNHNLILIKLLRKKNLGNDSIKESFLAEEEKILPM